LNSEQYCVFFLLSVELSVVCLCRQQALFHVLAAYSMYNTDVGYCQGMSQIAALLLMYFNEEVCFVECPVSADSRWRRRFVFRLSHSSSGCPVHPFVCPFTLCGSRGCK